MVNITVNSVVKQVNDYIAILYKEQRVTKPLKAEEVLRLIEKCCGAEGEDRFRLFRNDIILKNTDLAIRVKYRVFSGRYGYRKLTVIGCHLVNEKWGRYYISNVGNKN